MTKADKIYSFICAFFSVLIVTGNLIYQKFVFLPIPFHTFELSVGAILYPLSFLLTDLITEFFGKERANHCVKIAIGMNILMALIITYADSLTATEWSKISDHTFHQVFGAYGIAFIGSILACYTAQLIDIRIYLWIKKATKGKFLWLRNNGSTAISLFIDTTIVISFLTLFGILPSGETFSLIINSYCFKLFFTICSTPIFYLAVWVIRGLLQEKRTVIAQTQST